MSAPEHAPVSEIAHVPGELRAVAHRLLAMAEEAEFSVRVAGQLSVGEYVEIDALAKRLQHV